MCAYWVEIAVKTDTCTAVLDTTTSVLRIAVEERKALVTNVRNARDVTTVSVDVVDVAVFVTVEMPKKVEQKGVACRRRRRLMTPCRAEQT